MSNVPSSVRCGMCVHYEDGLNQDEGLDYDGRCFFRVPPESTFVKWRCHEFRQTWPLIFPPRKVQP